MCRPSKSTTQLHRSGRRERSSPWVLLASSPFTLRRYPVIEAVFTPTSDELAIAQRIVAAAEAAGGNAVQLDEKMIDVPVVKAALRTVRLVGPTTA